MKSWKIILLTGAFALILLAAVGCGSDPVAPQETIQMDAETAEQWSIQAIDMINQMAASAPLASQGDFTNLGPDKTVDEPTWDEGQMAWVMDQTVTFSEGEPPTSTGETRISVWIQFRNLEGPLPTPLGATEMEYRQAAGMTMHNEGEQGVSDLEFDMSTGMLVTYLDAGYGMNGTGNAHVAASATSDGRTQRMNLTMNWGMALTSPFEGCPIGTAFVVVGQYRTDVEYDGQGNANWTLTGPNYSASGTESVPCGSAM